MSITIEKSSGNVYADLGLADAQEMLVKAKLASKIGDIIKRQNLTQQQAAALLAMSQPKVSLLLWCSSRRMHRRGSRLTDFLSDAQFTL